MVHPTPYSTFYIFYIVSVITSQCNVTANTICRCSSPFFCDKRTGECIIDCQACPGTQQCRLDYTSACRCARPECHLPGDVACKDPHFGPCAPPLVTKATTSSDLRTPPLSDNSFPSWGIVLIAIAILMGIIVFAPCFLFLRRSNSDQSRHNSLVTNSIYLLLSSNYLDLSSYSKLQLLKNNLNSQSKAITYDV